MRNYPKLARKVAIWMLPISAILPLLFGLFSAWAMIDDNHQDELSSIPVVFMIFWPILYALGLIGTALFIAITDILATRAGRRGP